MFFSPRGARPLIISKQVCVPPLAPQKPSCPPSPLHPLGPQPCPPPLQGSIPRLGREIPFFPFWGRFSLLVAFPRGGRERFTRRGDYFAHRRRSPCSNAPRRFGHHKPAAKISLLPGLGFFFFSFSFLKHFLIWHRFPSARAPLQAVAFQPKTRG